MIVNHAVGCVVGMNCEIPVWVLVVIQYRKCFLCHTLFFQAYPTCKKSWNDCRILDVAIILQDFRCGLDLVIYFIRGIRSALDVWKSEAVVDGAHFTPCQVICYLL